MRKNDFVPQSEAVWDNLFVLTVWMFVYKEIQLEETFSFKVIEYQEC